MAQKAEGAIEVASADAEADAARIEGDEGRQHEIEPARIDLPRERRLFDAEDVASEQPFRGDGREAHSLADDDRCVDELALPRRDARDSRDRRLAVERVVDGEGACPVVDAETQDASADRALAGRASLGIERAAKATHLLTDVRALSTRGFTV